MQPTAMKTVLGIAAGLTAVFLILPADFSEAEHIRSVPAVGVESPELPEIIGFNVGDVDGDWLQAYAVPGAGEFLRPSPVGPSFPGPQPTGLYFLNVTTQDAFFRVCPAWHVPDCGTSAPNAAQPLTGTGMLQAQVYITSAGWRLRCPIFAKGDATVVDEDGNRFHVTLHEQILEDILTRECRTLQEEIHIEPIR